ncbi:sulfurtransferase [Thermostichus vulcanus]|nr:sulfurtransferase [Thermostichus vulcanus]
MSFSSMLRTATRSVRSWVTRHLRQLQAVLLVLPVALLGLSLTHAPAQPAKAASGVGIQFVSPDWVSAHAEDANLRILDVRIAPFAYFSGHIPGAVHIPDNAFRGPDGKLPVQYWPNDKLQSLFQQVGVTDDSQVLIYSDGNDVLGATMVAYLLERAGHPGAAVLNGGFKGYQAAGLPVTKEFPAYEPGRFTLKDDPSLRVTLEEVKNLIGKAGVTFVDPRPADLFAGDVDIWARNGHIPGAKNIPWPTFTIGEENFHQLKPLAEIQALLDERGVKKEDQIIVTCSTGREATLQYAVLKYQLGYPNVRVYEGSWTEYQQSGLPVETGPGA